LLIEEQTVHESTPKYVNIRERPCKIRAVSAAAFAERSKALSATMRSNSSLKEEGGVMTCESTWWFGLSTNNLTAVSTGIIALFTFLVWRSYRNIEFFTGAMARHSRDSFRLEVMRWNAQDGQQRQPIALTWFDKSVHRDDDIEPIENERDGQPADLPNPVRFSVARDRRARQPVLIRLLRAVMGRVRDWLLVPWHTR